MDIVAQNISKKFGDNQVLQDFSARFFKHGITVIMGPSGCGKTTLLNLLMGLMQPDRGVIRGVPYAKSAVFQEDRLCEEFSAISNVRLVCDRRTDDRMITAHLEQVGLAGSLWQPVGELSGGMRRRVAIVRAVLAQSEILFLDEPFRGLDDDIKEITMQYFKDNRRNRTTIIVTHDADEVIALDGVLLTMH